MDAAEFNALRTHILESDDTLATMLGVPVARLRQWGSGDRRIPRMKGRLLAFHAALAERENALIAAGLTKCLWIAEFDAAGLPRDVRLLEAAVKRAEEHEANCERCQARERYAVARFGPLPEFPFKAPAVHRMLGRLPERLHAAAYGALILVGVVSINIIPRISSAVDDPALALELLVGIVAAAGAGAAGGLAAWVVRPATRRLGRMGDYIAGVVYTAAHMFAFLLVAPISLGEDFTADRADRFGVVIVTLVLGLFIGHMWPGRSTELSGARAAQR